MSQQQQDAMQRLDVLLMRVIDGEASVAERAELLSLADADVRLAELSQLRSRLRDAVAVASSDPIEVVGEVMAALMLDDGWDVASEALREAVAEPSPVDLADGIMAALIPEPEPEPAALLSALHDGELSAEVRRKMAGEFDREALDALTSYAELGRMMREAVSAQVNRAAPIDAWEGVAHAIGLEDPNHVPGWEPLGDAIRAAVADASELSAEAEVAMTAAIMNSLPRPEVKPEPVVEPEPGRWSLSRWFAGSPATVVAVLAAMLLAVYAVGEQPPTVQQDGTEAVAQLEQVLEIQINNTAEVEALEYADDVFVQVVQLEDGAPILLMVDEGEIEEGATL